MRAFGVFASWVNDVDTLENNTLDMYVGPPGGGHVLHYHQDVGGALGTWAFAHAPYWMGHETYLDAWPSLAGRALAIAPRGPGRACVALDDDPAYRVVELAADPIGRRRPRPMRVHLARGRIVGVER